MTSARILAIDDSEQNLLQVELFLEGDEFEVVTARSGMAALDVLRESTVDLILLDVVMPNMDGFELCRRLKADPRTRPIPVIFLTARRRDESTRLAAFEVGGVDYLAKPFRKDELVARARVMLGLRQHRTRLESENRELSSRLEAALEGTRRLDEEVTRLRRLEAARRAARVGIFVVEGGGLGVAYADDRTGEMLGFVAGGGDEPTAEVRSALRRAVDAGVAALRLGSRDLVIDRLGGPAGALAMQCRDVTELEIAKAEVDELEPYRIPERESGAFPGYRVSGLIGESPGMLAVSERVSRLRDVRSTVLIQGETGTGKELVARALHYDGRFRDRPFIPIHCGAIAPDLIESELFGYEKGAFTGAQTRKQGLFTAADSGTVFLDEVAETSLDLQVKLLRVLQMGEVRPVGATNPLSVDIRIIAATNGDLADRVDEGRFRADLFYRLDCVTIELPPLRERLEDIPLLARHFLEVWNRRLEPVAPVREVSRGAMECMQAYSWPGNVRELENAMKRAVALGAGEVVQQSMLPHRVRTGERRAPRPRCVSAPDRITLAEQRERVDEIALRAALERFGGDRRAVASYLNISKSTLYRKLQRYGMT